MLIYRHYPLENCLVRTLEYSDGAAGKASVCGGIYTAIFAIDEAGTFGHALGSFVFPTLYPEVPEGWMRAKS
jgi:hypothetical protein